MHTSLTVLFQQLPATQLHANMAHNAAWWDLAPEQVTVVFAETGTLGKTATKRVSLRSAFQIRANIMVLVKTLVI